MKKERWLKTTAVLLAVFFITAGTAPADDMGTYMTNLLNGMENVGTIHAYQTQKRGYVLGGSMSVRVPQGSVNLFSFTPPDLHAGCNGIDLVMGGFSYLNADMIVKKLQEILQAAPFVAFDLAINTLCQPCKSAMSAAEHFSQIINKLQLDSCKAAQALMGAAWEGLGGPEVTASLAAKKNTDDDTESGKSSSWAKSLDKAVSNLNDTLDKYAAKYQIAVATGGGTKETNALDFLKNRTLVDVLVDDWGSIDASWKDTENFKKIIKAVAGNVVHTSLSKNGHVIGVAYITPPDETPEVMEKIETGGFLKQPDDSEAQLSYTTNKGTEVHSLIAFVQDELQDIYDKIANGGALTPAEIHLMDMTTVPVYSYLKLCYMLNDPAFTNGTIQQISPYIAAEMAYYLIADAAQQAKALTNGFKKGGLYENLAPNIKGQFVKAVDKFVESCKKAQEAAAQFVDSERQKFADSYKSFLDDYKQKQLMVNRILRKYKFASAYAIETTLGQETGGVF